jgi:hypothetical protein
MPSQMLWTLAVISKDFLMNRKKDIEALLARADKTEQRIFAEYDQSLHSQEISADLRIDIKDFFGNLRSVLDYIAHDIVDAYCPNANPRNNLYFPIRADQNNFDIEINRSYPDLPTNKNSVYVILNDNQPFIRDENKWLSFFNKLNNENKHERLVPQTRTETKRVTVTGQEGGSVSWGPGVTFGGGVSIMGVPIDPNTQLPVPNNIVTTEIVTWVDFQFEGLNVSALWLIKESLKKINKIFSDLQGEIY